MRNFVKQSDSRISETDFSHNHTPSIAMSQSWLMRRLWHMSLIGPEWLDTIEFREWIREQLCGTNLSE